MTKDNPHHHHRHLPADPEYSAERLQELLVQKGLVDEEALDEIVNIYEHKIGPQNGSRVVARSWIDPGFKNLLFDNPAAAIKQLGFGGRQGEHIIAVENTPAIHNLVVCTLCSCYPWPLLGIPPNWYKSDAYRQRAVREPRAVLYEFGVKLLSGQKVRVWDSTAEIRYLVVPMQPEDSMGLTEEELVPWITRNSMIGTGLPTRP